MAATLRAKATASAPTPCGGSARETARLTVTPTTAPLMIPIVPTVFEKICRRDGSIAMFRLTPIASSWADRMKERSTSGMNSREKRLSRLMPGA